jgi:ribosomal protein S18 acetylase RimI-like enzyme
VGQAVFFPGHLKTIPRRPPSDPLIRENDSIVSPLKSCYSATSGLTASCQCDKSKNGYLHTAQTDEAMGSGVHMSEMIEIARVNESAVEEIQQLSIQTFVETFSVYFTPEDLQAYLHDAFSIERLRMEIRNSSTEWYIARAGVRNAGYLKINRAGAQTDLRDPRSIEIERIYVLKRFQGRKIGAMLLKRGVDTAISSNAEYVWLGVWEHNHNAIGFYRKHGFIPFGTHDFMVGTEKQTDILMKLIVTR